MNAGLRQRRRSLAVQPRRAAAFATTLTALVFACGQVQKDGQSQRNESGSGGSGGTTSPTPLPSTMPIPSIGGEPTAVAGGGGASSPVGDGGQPLSGGGGGITCVEETDDPVTHDYL